MKEKNTMKKLLLVNSLFFRMDSAFFSTLLPHCIHKRVLNTAWLTSWLIDLLSFTLDCDPAGASCQV